MWNQITRHFSDHFIQMVDKFDLHKVIPLYAMSFKLETSILNLNKIALFHVNK